MSRSQWLRGVVATVLISTGIATARGQQTAAPSAQQKMNFDIARQPVAEALTALGEQSGLTIMLVSAAKSDAVSPAVVGDYTPDEALRKILDFSGLRAEYLDENTVKVSTASTERKASKPDGSGQAPSNGDESETKKGSAPTSDSTDPIGTTPEEVKPRVPEILVVGSRLMNVDVNRTEDDVQPYTILSAKEIERSSATNVEDLLKQQLTMNTTVQTSAQSYGAPYGSTSSINLRGLGTNETLILVDGRRVAGVSFEGNTNQPDINGIPLSAIERIEVLPSSASAIYGGAAMGGVVNVILKRNFEGVDIGYSYDTPIDVSASTRTIDASFGVSLNDARTQLMVAGHYSDGSPLLLGDRQDLINGGIQTILNNYPAYLESPSKIFDGATPNIAASSTFDFSNYPACASGPAGFSGCQSTPDLVLKNNTPLNAPITSISRGTSPATDPTGGLISNAGKYNLNLSNGTGFHALGSPFGAVPRTKSILATLRQSLFDNVEAFASLSTSSNSTRTTLNPFILSPYTVPSGAPTNPFLQDVQVTFPSTVPAESTTDSVTQSMTIGLIAPLGHGWRGELDYTWSRNSFESEFQHSDDGALSADLAIGTLNPFVDTLAYPLDLSPYLVPTSYSGNATLNDLSLRASGDLIALPAGELALTVGLEHRKEGSHDGNLGQVYPLTPSNDLQEVFFGQSQSTNSIYVEALVPLVTSRNRVFGTRSLELQVAGRSERYSVITGTPYAFLAPSFLAAVNPPQGVRQEVNYTSTNPTIGLKYEPIGGVAIRASYARAFLPPTTAQLLSDPTPVLGNQITDPKNGQTYFISTINGGNPLLKPQTSKNWDFGMIWEPQSISFQGIRIDVEYYKITQPNYIVTPLVQQLVSDPAFASRVTRDPATGLITTVNDSPVNATEYKTSGWDAKLTYDRPTSLGTFDFQLASTFIKYDLRQFQLDSPFLEYAGFPNDSGEGKIKANLRLGWARGGWALSWTATYFSSYYQDGTPQSPTTLQFPGYVGPSLAQGNYAIPSQTYHDLYVSYTFVKGGEAGWRDWRGRSLLANTSIQLGVRNVFNSRPPFDAFYDPYFYSAYGDPRLRDYRLTLKKAF